MDLSHLSEKEREAILQVLQRDEELRKRDEQKLHHLKNELHFLRKRGALRGDLDPESSCSRCRVELGRMLNRGATCVSCQSRVCKSCRVYDPTADEQWVCVVCHKQMEIQAASGEWMNEFIRRPSRKRDNKVFVPPSDVIKHSICRSWTSADGFARDIDTSGAIKETRQSRHVTPNETPRHPPSTSQKMMDQSRAQSQKIPPAIIHVPQPSITAPARPATRKQRPVTSPEEPVVVVAESSPKPVRQLPNPTPRASRILPTPPVPRQRSPRGLKVSESERSESQDSGYVTSQVTVSPGIETRDSPRVLRKSSVDERSTVIARDVSPSASDASDGEEEERGVVFRKVMVRKKRESGIRKTSSVFAGPQTQPRWSRSGQGPDGNARREVRSWSAEDNPASPDEKPSPTKPTKTMPKTSAVAVPQISVSDIQDMGSSVQSNPSGRSSLGSQNNSDRESAPDEDIDRLVALHKTRSSLSSLGNRSDSMTSVYSAAGGGRYGTVVVRGEVLFGLNYNFKLGALEISIKNCRDLAPVDTKRNRSDPYVKVYLLPDKSKSGKRKTKVRKHTLNPTFDEVLRFFVTISELETRTLWLTVWHSDMFGRNDFLGEVTLPLGYGVFEDDSSPQWYRLQERLGPPEEVMTYKGELIIALKYVPPDVTTQKKGKQGKGSLHVLVKEARNLTAVRSNGTSDPFCKCYLLPDKSKGSKQKTPVVKKNCNPRWNHTFVHDDVSQEDLRDRCLELTVWDYDRLTSNDFLGGVRLSLGLGRYQGKEVDWLDSSGDEIALWQSMLDKPNVWIDGYVFLQPSMEKRPI